MQITGHTVIYVATVKLFSWGAIIFVQARFIILFFDIVLLSHNSKAMSDFH